MTPKDLLSLYALRSEIEAKARERYQLGIGKLYSPELKKIDAQIDEIERRIGVTPYTISPLIRPELNADHLKKKDGWIEIKLKHGVLRLHQEMGLITLNKSEATLPTNGKEYRVLFLLMTAPEHYVTYNDLLGISKLHTDDLINLGFILRNIKKSLNILPREKRRNKDIFRNVRGKGYRLNIELHPNHNSTIKKL